MSTGRLVTGSVPAPRHPLPGPPPEARLVIETRGLTKRYGAQAAVDDVDLHVRAGERYGFLGPNGSGKTTLVRMLLGLVFATRGEIRVLGHEVPKQVHEILPRIGAHGGGARRVRPPLRALQPRPARRLRPEPALRAAARVDDALERVGLAGVDRRAVRTYSLGMRQRLGLAGALLTQPDLLILDEPTNGLDPHGIREIRELLVELNEAGTTVFLSSHLLTEIEALCTHVGVVDRGRLVLEEPLDAVRRETGRVVVDTPDVERAAGRPRVRRGRAHRGGRPGGRPRRRHGGAGPRHAPRGQRGAPRRSRAREGQPGGRRREAHRPRQ